MECISIAAFRINIKICYYGKSRQDRLLTLCKLSYSITLNCDMSILKGVTVFHRDILYLHLFLNTGTLLLGEEPRFMTLRLSCHVTIPYWLLMLILEAHFNRTSTARNRFQSPFPPCVRFS